MKKDNLKFISFAIFCCSFIGLINASYAGELINRDSVELGRDMNQKGKPSNAFNRALGATPVITLGGSINIPLGASKNKAFLPLGAGVNAGVYFPVWAKGFDGKVRKYLSFGLNASGSYGLNVQQLRNGDYKAIDIIGQSSPPTLVLNTGNEKIKSQYYNIDAGPQLNFSVGGFMLSTIFNLGYMNIRRNDISVKQTTTFTDTAQAPITLDLYGQKITKSAGLAIIPKLRLAYFFGKTGIGIWAEGEYTYGPSVNVETTRFVPNENPLNPGIYDIGLINEGTQVKNESNFHYGSFSVNAGICFATKPFKKRQQWVAGLQNNGAGQMPAPLPPPSVCGSWNVVQYDYYPTGDWNVYQHMTANCNDIIHVAQGSRIFPRPGVDCVPAPCSPAGFYGEIQDANGSVLLKDTSYTSNAYGGGGTVAEYQFSTCGTYLLKLNGTSAAGQPPTCATCSFHIIVDCPPTCSNNITFSGISNSISCTQGGYVLNTSITNGTSINISSWTVSSNDATLMNSSGGPIAGSPSPINSGTSIAANTINFTNPTQSGHVTLTFTFTFSDGTTCVKTQAFDYSPCPPPCDVSVSGSISCTEGTYSIKPFITNAATYPITSWTVSSGDVTLMNSSGGLITGSPSTITDGFSVTANTINFSNPVNPSSVTLTFTFTFSNGTHCILTKQFAYIVCLPCQCYNWNSIPYKKNGTTMQPITQGSTINGISGDNFIFSPSYTCSSGCTQSNQSYTIYNNGATVGAPGRPLTAATGPLSAGTYLVRFNGNCGSAACTCVITIIIQDCICGTWTEYYKYKNVGANWKPGKAVSCNDTIKALQNAQYIFITTFSCNPVNPAGSNCTPLDTKYTIYRNGVIIVPATAMTSDYDLNYTFTECGNYKIIFEGQCGSNYCRCEINVFVDCCGGRTINMFTHGETPLTDPNACIRGGDIYNFKLSSPLPINISQNITYQLITLPNNVDITGQIPNPVATTTYSAAGINLTMPAYSCEVTKVWIKFTWNDGNCSDIIERNICNPCCDYINTLPHIAPVLGGIPANKTATFISNFSLPAGINTSPVVFSKIKVQLISITRLPNSTIPNANIFALNITSAVTGNPIGNNIAIAPPGDAVWFHNISISTPASLNFTGRIINLGNITLPALRFTLRYTFYRNNGSCAEIICEKEISYP